MPSIRAAAAVTPRVTYASLCLRFRVHSDDHELADAFGLLYRSCRTDAGSETAAVLELATGEGGCSARIDAGAPALVDDRRDLLLAAAALVDGAAVDASADDLLILHASSVMTHSGPLLLVGPSGAGKSTLAAALTMRGHQYVGDEALGLDAAGPGLFANPKPLKLDRGSRRALFVRQPVNDLAALQVDTEMLLAPHDLGPVVRPGPVGAPAAVVRIQFRAGAGAQVGSMSRADVAETLADQCYNFARWGARGLDTVAALARHASGYSLEFGDLEHALAALDEVLS